jgi:hypothetical protein
MEAEGEFVSLCGLRAAQPDKTADSATRKKLAVTRYFRRRTSHFALAICSFIEFLSC